MVSATSVNTEDGFSSLFKDIGNTLMDVTKQGLSTVASTVKTNLANQIIKSPEGMAQIAAYKMDYIMKYLPWFALAALGIFLSGKFFTRS